MGMYRHAEKKAPLGYGLGSKHRKPWGARATASAALLLALGTVLLTTLIACAGGGGATTDTAGASATWVSPTAYASPGIPPTPTPPAAMPAYSEEAPGITAYREPSRRELRLLVRDPDAHAGEAYLIYGVVTQADPMTGATMVRADIGGEWETDSQAYDVNVVLHGTTAMMSDIVEDMRIVAEVRVLGSVTYESTVGAITAPRLYVDSISEEYKGPGQGA